MPVRQQVITWTNVDSDLCCHMASLGPNELPHIVLNLFFRKNKITFAFLISSDIEMIQTVEIFPPGRQRSVYPAYSIPCNYANPVYGVATICHQVRWLRWGHPSLFHTATSLLIWYKMFCMRDISYRLIWMEFINVFSVYAQSGTHSRFNW